MCGRFSLSKPKKFKLKELKVKKYEITPDLLPARYNIAPVTTIAAVLDDGDRTLALPKWGLVAYWAKDEKLACINARSETLTEKPMFKNLISKNRCAILSDGFYEWKTTPQGKQPYYIRLKNEEPFVFAELWSKWKSPTKGEIRTAAIITTSPNAVMERIHNRMPVILTNSAIEEWLNSSEKDAIKLLTPYDAAYMEAYPVSKIVNRPENDVEECMNSLKQKTDQG